MLKLLLYFFLLLFIICPMIRFMTTDNTNDESIKTNVHSLKTNVDKIKISKDFYKCRSDSDCTKFEVCKKIDQNTFDCVLKNKLGGSCSFDTDCINNKCIMNKCTNKNGKFIKDMICTMNDQCDENLICRKKDNIMKCSELGLEGDDCYSNEHCNDNLWCSLENTCTLKRKDGEFCFGHDEACKSGICKNMYCMTNKDGEYYIPEGAPGCITDKDCLPGLVCSNMGYKQLVCQKKN